MSIPKEGRRSMDTAPRNGDIILVIYHQYNDKKKLEECAYAQWGCDQYGNTWTWRAPYRMGTVQYADSWMPYEEFLTRSQRGVEPVTEYDL